MEISKFNSKVEEFKRNHKVHAKQAKKDRLGMLEEKIQSFRKDYQRWKDIGMPAWLRVTAKKLSRFNYWKKEMKKLRWQIRKLENPDREERGITDEMVWKAKQIPLERFIDIKKKGSPKMALCPFHDDKSPSLAIYDNNTYYCFGCGTSGDVIKYIQEARDLDFVNAVKFLL